MPDGAARRAPVTDPPTAASGGHASLTACACGRHVADPERIEVCLPCRRAFNDGFWWPADEVIQVHPSWPVEFLDRVCPDCAAARRHQREEVSG